MRVSGVFATTATAPPDIERAALLLAARLFGRREATLGFVGGGSETGAVRLARSDPDVYTLLQRRKRYGFGRRSN